MNSLPNHPVLEMGRITPTIGQLMEKNMTTQRVWFLGIISFVALVLAAETVSAQRGGRRPALIGGTMRPSFSTNQHWGCLGYCNGPINSTRQYWGCLGYCNGPLNPNRQYWGCLGYCNGPLVGNSIYPYDLPDNSSLALGIEAMNYPYEAAFYAATHPGYSTIPFNPPGEEPPPEITQEPRPVETIQKDLLSKEALVRNQAVIDLTKVKAKESANLLMSMLKDPSPIVRTNAAAALARLGKDGLEFVSPGLFSDDRLTRMGTALALGMMGKDAKPVEGTLKSLLKDSDIRVRGHAAQALYRVTGDAKTVVPVLAQGLADEDEHVRMGFLQALSNIGKDSKEAAPAIKKLLEDPNSLIRGKAAETLWQIEEDHAALEKLLLPVAEKLAKDNDPGVRAEGVVLLGLMGKKTASAIPLLKQAVKDPDHVVGQTAANSLAQAVDPAVSALAEGLTDKDPNTRWRSASALARMGDKALPALSPLISALTDKEIAVRWESAQVLGNLKAAAKEAVPALINALADPAYQVRLIAAEALGEIGPDAKLALPALMKAEMDKRGEVVDAARASQKKIQK